jgi:peptide/nickel transport system permease protein
MMMDTVPAETSNLTLRAHAPWLRLSRRPFKQHRPALAGAAVILIIALTAIFAPLLSPYDPEKSHLEIRIQAPSAQHILGTDDLGRDLFTRILYGSRISLAIGLYAMALAVTVGTVIGAAAGFYGGWVDGLLMRVTDVFLAFPRLFVLILLTTILRQLNLPWLAASSFVPIAFVIGSLSWMSIARLVRASYLSIKEREFVEAARGVGARNARIMFRHILPNAASPIIVAATLGVAASILTESGLSYLGFGVQLPTPTWGNLLQNAQAQMTYAPWMALFPGLMIFCAVIAINYVGDGLRDALDSRRGGV